MMGQYNETVSGAGFWALALPRCRTMKTRTFRHLSLLVILVLVLLPATGVTAAHSATTDLEPPASAPNLILILADDLDLQLNSLSYMPNLQRLLVQQGMTFTSFYVPVSLCCPSRVSLLSGQYVHNHQIFSNQPPAGGFEKAFATGIERGTVAVALQQAGYRTALLGKYLNGYPHTATPTYLPPGWDEWYSPINHKGYLGYDYKLNDNGALVAYGHDPEDYLTDVLASKAVNFITRATEQTPARPFFVKIAPFTPHTPATPAPRHSAWFPNTRAPRTPSFNEADVSDKPSFIQQQPLLTAEEITRIDEQYRRRLRSLQAIDDMVAQIVQVLTQTGQLDNTYIFFSSDNGYHMGQHRMMPGKYLPYEEDVRVPLVVRGPGVPPASVRLDLASSIDLAPTFAELAGLGEMAAVDGRSLVTLLHTLTPPYAWRTAVFIEQYPFDREAISNQGVQEPPDEFDSRNTQLDHPSATYFGLRTTRYKYIEYATGERELYDLVNDPHELNNLAAFATPAFLRQASAWIMDFSQCSRDSCRQIDAREPPLLELSKRSHLPSAPKRRN